jgi:hypothetical protein
MRTRGVRLTVALALALALAGSASSAHAASAVSLGPGSALWLTGKSTMHDYESRTTELSFSLLADPGARAPADPASLETLIRSSRVHGVEATVPVRSLHSKKKGLDKNLWKTLNADKYPTICFRLSRYTLAPGAADTMSVHAEGTLEVAGQERPAKLEARAYRSGKGVWLEGNEPLLMSDFGIRPPKMMMGTLRVADEIVVHYRLLLVPGGDSPVSSKERGR